MFIIKIILIVTFLIILYQDLKERQVYWFLFPIVGICSGILMYLQMSIEVFISTILFNLSITTIYLLLIFLYSKHIKKMKLNEVIGSGDIFLFYMLCFTFAIVSFYILFAFSLAFALVLQFLIKKNFKNKTIPLAGFMNIFFGLVYISYWTGIIDSIYLI